MGSLSLWHWLIVLVVVLLLFGRGKISDLMGDVAKGVNAFKKGLKDEDETTLADQRTLDQRPVEPVPPVQRDRTSVS